jgi:hypothetical protein
MAEFQNCPQFAEYQPPESIAPAQLDQTPLDPYSSAQLQQLNYHHHPQEYSVLPPIQSFPDVRSTVFPYTPFPTANSSPIKPRIGATHMEVAAAHNQLAICQAQLYQSGEEIERLNNHTNTRIDKLSDTIDSLTNTWKNSQNEMMDYLMAILGELRRNGEEEQIWEEECKDVECEEECEVCEDCEENIAHHAKRVKVELK